MSFLMKPFISEFSWLTIIKAWPCKIFNAKFSELADLYNKLAD